VRAAENLDDGGQKITRYRWDHRDRLREVILANGDRVRFTYDAFARRVKKEIVPAAAFAPTDAEIAALLEEGAAPIAPRPRTVEYVWDRGDLALEIDSERGERAFVALPSGAPLLHDEGGEIFTAVTDPVGVPRELLDEEGRVAWAGRFNAWGRLLEEQPREAHPVRPPFRLLGQFADEETDLAYTRFRYWDAPVAHWISPDPAGLAGGPDLFGYNGNPLLHPDPLGLACYLINNTAAASFVDGKYTSRTLTHEEVMWRAGVKGKPYGQYFSHDEPTSVAQVRRDKAVLPVWPNGDASPMDAKHQHIVRPGTRVYEGVVAPQTGNDGTVYPGGTPQVFIPRGVHGSSLTPIAEKDLT
jgi:RHS repeat-associated protein